MTFCSTSDSFLRSWQVMAPLVIDNSKKVGLLNPRHMTSIASEGRTNSVVDCNI